MTPSSKKASSHRPRTAYRSSFLHSVGSRLRGEKLKELEDCDTGTVKLLGIPRRTRVEKDTGEAATADAMRRWLHGNGVDLFARLCEKSLRLRVTFGSCCCGSVGLSSL